MAAPTLNPATLISELRRWLSQNAPRITSFWIGADWNTWARYEIYMFLQQAFGSDALVSHGVQIWNDGDIDEEVDVLIEPQDSNEPAAVMAIKLRCEKVSENEGSFERFRGQMDGDMTRIKELGAVESTFERGTLLLVGFSGEPLDTNEDCAFQTRPEPKHFHTGEVHAWIMEYELPVRE